MGESTGNQHGLRDRLKMAIVGVNRSGKTKFAELFASEYIKAGQGMCIVYNYGKPSDWIGFEPFKYVGEGVLESLQVSSMGRQVNIWDLYGSEVMIKVRKIYDKKEQEEFLRYVIDYLNNVLFINDDALNTLPAKGQLSPTLEEMYNTPDHLHIDVISIFHSLRIPPAMYDYLNRMIQFETRKGVKKSDRDLVPEFETLMANYDHLKGKKKYHFFELNFDTYTNDFRKPLNI